MYRAYTEELVGCYEKLYESVDKTLSEQTAMSLKSELCQ